MSDKQPDKKKYIIYQKPNLPLIVFIVFYILGLIITKAPTIYLIKSLAFGSIFTWSWLEITDGVNNYRKALGVIVLIASVASALSYMHQIAK